LLDQPQKTCIGKSQANVVSINCTNRVALPNVNVQAQVRGWFGSGVQTEIFIPCSTSTIDIYRPHQGNIFHMNSDPNQSTSFST